MGDTAGECGHRFLLLRHHDRQVKSNVIKLDSSLLQIGRVSLMVEVAVVEQRFGGYAADVETGAAQSGVLFHADGLHAQLGGFDGGDITAGTGTDHHLVEKLISGVSGQQ